MIDSSATTQFLVKRRSKYVSMLISAGAMNDDIPEDLNSFASSIVQNPEHLLISCPEVESIPQNWLKVMTLISQQIRLSKKELCFVHGSDSFKTFLEANAGGLKFSFHKTMDEALERILKDNSLLSRINYIKVFVACTQRTLFIQAQVKCTQGKIMTLPHDAKEKLVGDISGFILVENPEFSYIVLVSFPEKTFLKVLSKMLDTEFTEVTPDTADGATEIMNIIYGQAKLVLNARNAGIKPAIPTLVMGRTIPLNTTDDKLAKAAQLLDTGKIVVVPFETEVGPFYVQICFPVKFLEVMMAM